MVALDDSVGAFVPGPRQQRAPLAGLLAFACDAAAVLGLPV